MEKEGLGAEMDYCSVEGLLYTNGFLVQQHYQINDRGRGAINHAEGEVKGVGEETFSLTLEDEMVNVLLGLLTEDETSNVLVTVSLFLETASLSVGNSSLCVEIV